MAVVGRVELASGEAGYRVLVCGTDPVVTAGSIATEHGLEALAEADTIVVPGRHDVSVAFTLAATGPLDGERATTHWRATTRSVRHFPPSHWTPTCSTSTTDGC